VTVTVNQKTLTPTITGTTEKVYDGTTDAPAGLSITLADIVGSGNVTATATSYTYDSAGAGDNKTITATGITLDGTAAGNYKLSSTEATIAGKITQAPVTLTFSDQTITYGGTPTQATVEPASAKITYSYVDTTDSTKTGTGWPANAGTYTVIASVAETGDYGSATQSITLTINKATALTPTPGTLEVRNKQAKTYSFNLDQLLPEPGEGKTLGTVSYALGTVNFTTTGYYTDGAVVNGSVLTLPINSVDSQDLNDIGTIEITITSTNYEDMTATITVSSVNKTPVNDIIGVSVAGRDYNGHPITYTEATAAEVDGKTVSVKGFTLVNALEK